MRGRLALWVGSVFVSVMLATSGLAVADQIGRTAGVIVNVGDGSFLSNVSITVLPAGPTAQSDLDGNYLISLPAGTYDFEFRAAGFMTQRVTGIVVKTEQTTVQDVALNPENMQLGEVTVVAEAQKASEVALLAERRGAATVQDSIGAHEISKTTGSNASDLMQRVTGVSIVDNRFVYVRGLGERYSSTMLNGSVVPSTQPDKKVVSFDLFPASLLENIRTEKSYTPGQPGEVSAGLVKLETVDFPRNPTLKVSYGQGFDTSTTFKNNFLTYSGGKNDWWGSGVGSRSLPAGIPSQRLVRRGAFDTSGFTPEQLQQFGQAFSNTWDARSSEGLPEQKFSLVAGDTIGRFGLVFAVAKNNTYHQQREKRNLYVLGGDNQLNAKNSYDFDIGQATVRTGIVGNLAYQVSQNHRLIFRNFYTRDGADETRILEGANGDLARDIRDTRLRYTLEGVYSGQLSGEHLMPKLWNSMFEWRVTYSRSTLDEPDMRETVYDLDQATGEYTLFSDSQSGLRTFTDLNERIWDPAVDWTKFFTLGRLSGSFKIGASHRTRERDFDYRRFRFMFRNVRSLDLTLPAEQLFVPENIGPNGFEIREETRNTDHYEAKQITRAFYGMLDTNLGRRWRVIGGLRVENDTQNVRTFDLYKPDFPPVISRLNKTDPLPAASLIYRARMDMNLRVSISQTLNRPEFRELAPFEFTDVIGGYSAIGNPDLERTRVRNYDARWDWFPSSTELISVGFFKKDFENPIERVIQPTSSLRTTFVNAQGAANWGLEFDIRKGLAPLWAPLEPLSASVNYTLVDSNIEIGQQDLVVVTSLSRPLAGQSRHVLNGVLEFHHENRGSLARLLFNYRGRRISDVGALGVPDIFESGYPRLDALFSQPLGEGRQWGLKLSAENLLNHIHEYTQGGLPVRTYTTGRKFSVTLSYSFFGE